MQLELLLPPLQDFLLGSDDDWISWSEVDTQRGLRTSLPGSRQPDRQLMEGMTWTPGGRSQGGGPASVGSGTAGTKMFHNTVTKYCKIF